MKRKYVRAFAACLLAGGAMAHIPAICADLQVAPVSITLPADKTADAIWLSNPGTKPLQAQVRVLQWVQADGADHLMPTTELMASPPMLSIMPGQRQMVRVMRMGGQQPPASTEQSFRIVIDEIPTQGRDPGLQFALRYSLPVFISGQDITPPALSWRVEREGQAVWLRATNTGGSHARISDVTFITQDGRSIPLSKGLYGYALANNERRWELPRESKVFLDGGTVKATINQQSGQFRISSAKAS